MCEHQKTSYMSRPAFPSKYFHRARGSELLSDDKSGVSAVTVSNNVITDLKFKYSHIDDPLDHLLSLTVVFLNKLTSSNTQCDFMLEVCTKLPKSEDNSDEDILAEETIKIPSIADEIDATNLCKIIEEVYSQWKSLNTLGANIRRIYFISFQNEEKLEISYKQGTNEAELKFLRPQINDLNYDGNLFLQDLHKFLVSSTSCQECQPISFEMKRLENILLKHKPIKNIKFVYMNQDQFDVHLEIELGSSDLIVRSFQRQWEFTFDFMYSKLTDEHPYFGWTSSFTGDPIPVDQMEIWTRNTVQCILDNCHPSVVLEVGCGSGLILLPIAPKCKKYVGTDFSSKSLQKLGSILAKNPKQYSHVTLKQCEAIAVLEEEKLTYDTIICNSVVQYFRDSAYLVKTLENLIKVCKPGGKIFLGDLLSMANLQHLQIAIQLHKLSATTNASRAEFLASVRNSIFFENELNIHPNFFHLFAQEHQDSISGFDILLHRGIRSNELMDFRYNVILHVRGENNTSKSDSYPPKFIDFKIGQTITDLTKIIKTEENILIQGIPNARTSQYLAALSYLPPKNENYMECLKNHMDELKSSVIHPEELALIAEDSDHRVVRIMPSKKDPANKFDILCTKNSNCLYKYSNNFKNPGHGKTYADYVSDPVTGKNRRNAERALKQFLLTNKLSYDISRFHLYDDDADFVNSTNLFTE